MEQSCRGNSLILKQNNAYFKKIKYLTNEKERINKK